MKLGKLPPRHDLRTLDLARYVDTSVLPTPPASTRRAETAHTTFAVFGNDKAGDCTIAGRGNLRRFWAAITSRAAPVTDTDVLTAYTRLTGYDPATGANDTGAVELDVLNDWRKVPFAGETIDAYAAIDIRDDEQTRLGIYLFDGIYAGYELPESALEQFRAGEPFTVVPGAPVAGGHCMVEVDYDADGVWLVTWGRLVHATWDWVHTYRDEGYAIISSLDQLLATGLTVDGLDLAHLSADLAAVTA